MKKQPLQDLDDVLLYRLYRIGRLLRLHLQGLLGEGDASFTPEQYFLLYRLSVKDGLSQRQLADRALNDHPNITRIVDRLRKRGYVRREAVPGDRRTLSIRLTEKGRQLAGRMGPAIERERERMLKGITAEDTRTIRDALDRLERNINAQRRVKPAGGDNE